MVVEARSQLHVTVTYPSAVRPFQGEFDPATTVGALKMRVLDAFGLTEGTMPDGTTVTYTLYHQKTPLETLGQTLGEIAGHAQALELKLAQEITQGTR
jgi:hypothetical protein